MTLEMFGNYETTWAETGSAGKVPVLLIEPATLSGEADEQPEVNRRNGNIMAQVNISK